MSLKGCSFLKPRVLIRDPLRVQPSFGYLPCGQGLSLLILGLHEVPQQQAKQASFLWRRKIEIGCQNLSSLVIEGDNTISSKPWWYVKDHISQWWPTISICCGQYWKSFLLGASVPESSLLETSSPSLSLFISW